MAQEVKVFAVPAKSRLAYLRVQLFWNEQTAKGKSQRVLKLRYRTKLGDKYHEMLIPLSDNSNRNLRKKFQNVLGAAEADQLMTKYKDLKERYSPFFGFRQVSNTSFGAKGGKRTHNKADGKTQAWLICGMGDDISMHVELQWAGETIYVDLQPCMNRAKDNSPICMGYFNRDQDLLRNLENRMQHHKPVADADRAVCGIGNTLEDACTPSTQRHCGGYEEIEPEELRDNSGLAASTGDERQNTLRAEQETAPSHGHQLKGTAARTRTVVPARLGRRSTNAVRDGDPGKPFDRAFAHTWFAADPPMQPVGLGTAIRIWSQD